MAFKIIGNFPTQSFGGVPHDQGVHVADLMILIVVDAKTSVAAMHCQGGVKLG
jgi:hypothetical protein